MDTLSRTNAGTKVGFFSISCKLIIFIFGFSKKSVHLCINFNLFTFLIMTTQQNKNYTLPIVMMIILFGMISFVTNLAAPMGIVLKNQFGVSNFLGMLGNAANFIAYAVMGIPGGILLQKMGYKKTALIAIAVGFIGVGIQYLSGHASHDSAFAIYLLGAFVAGFSMCLLNTVVNPMLNTLGGGGNKGNQLIQVGGSFNSVMATFTPMFVGILIGELAKANITDVFPVMYIAMGIFALVFVVLATVNIPEPNAEKSAEPLGSLLSGALKFRHFVLGAIAIFVYVGVEVGIPGTMNLFLSDPLAGGLDTATAGFVVGTYWFLMLIGRLVGAFIGGKVSSKAMLSVASLVGLVLVTCAIFFSSDTSISLPVLQKGATGNLSFGLAQVPINAMFLVLVGLCTSIMWGGIFNLAVEGLGKYLAAASGIFMVLVCGGGLLPALQATVADAAGYMTSYWVIFAGLAYLLYYALAGSKNVNKDIPV
jgi:FHS family L-fucose permease-like MFS transporter